MPTSETRPRVGDRPRHKIQPDCESVWPIPAFSAMGRSKMSIFQSENYLQHDPGPPKNDSRRGLRTRAESERYCASMHLSSDPHYLVTDACPYLGRRGFGRHIQAEKRAASPPGAGFTQRQKRFGRSTVPGFGGRTEQVDFLQRGVHRQGLRDHGGPLRPHRHVCGDDVARATPVGGWGGGGQAPPGP